MAKFIRRGSQQLPFDQGAFSVQPQAEVFENENQKVSHVGERSMHVLQPAVAHVLANLLYAQLVVGLEVQLRNPLREGERKHRLLGPAVNEGSYAWLV